MCVVICEQHLVVEACCMVWGGISDGNLNSQINIDHKRRNEKEKKYYIDQILTFHLLSVLWLTSSFNSTMRLIMD